MRAESDTEAAPLPAQTSAVKAVATMAAVALISVVAVLGFARLGSDGASAEDPDIEPIPSQMAGGSPPGEVPVAVAETMGDQPVVGVATLQQLPEMVEEECSRNAGPVNWDEGAPTLEYAYAGPEAISLGMIGRAEPPDGWGGPKAERWRLVCAVSDREGMWLADVSSIEPVGGGSGMGGLSSGSSCCDENGMASASGQVSVPDGAAWAVQDRSGWYLAYPVKGSGTLNLTWKYRENRFGPGVPPQSSVTFLNERGKIIGEGFAGGQF